PPALEAPSAATSSRASAASWASTHSSSTWRRRASSSRRARNRSTRSRFRRSAARARGRGGCARQPDDPLRAVRDHAAVRVLERLDEIYSIGATRAGYSPEEDAAHELAADWMREAGLEPSADEAGNLIGRRGAARVWTGSHLDSVPNGGKFDGALGAVAGIEAAERLPDVELAVVVVRAEEAGPMGSGRL